MTEGATGATGDMLRSVRISSVMFNRTEGSGVVGSIVDGRMVRSSGSGDGVSRLPMTCTLPSVGLSLGKILPDGRAVVATGV